MKYCLFFFIDIKYFMIFNEVFTFYKKSLIPVRNPKKIDYLNLIYTYQLD